MAKLFEKIDDNPGEYFNMLLENYDGLNEDVEYIKWVQLPNKKWKMWGSSSSSKLDPDFINKARKQNDINYLDAKISKNGEYPDGVFEKDIETVDRFKKEEFLKEDKFVSRDKMSKKAQKELNDKKRGTWGNTNPVTRVQPNKKAYDRKKDKKELDESSSTFEKVLKEEDGKIFMDTVGKKLIILGNGMQHLSGNERIKFDDIVYYYKLLEDAYKAYGDYLKNSNSLKLRPWNYEDTTLNYPDDYYGDYFN